MTARFVARLFADYTTKDTSENSLPCNRQRHRSMPLYLRTLINVTHFFLVYLNINLIVYRKFIMLQIEWFFRLLNLIISHPHLSAYIGSQQHSAFSSDCFFLFISRCTTKFHSTLKIFCPWNLPLIMHALRSSVQSLLSFLKSNALHVGTGPLLMLHLFYGTRCH